MLLNYPCHLQAGNYVRDDVVSCTIQLVSESTAQQGYIVVQLWHALESDTMDRQPLTQVATWCIGEYGDLLLYGPPGSEDNHIRVRVSSERISCFTWRQQLCRCLTCAWSVWGMSLAVACITDGNRILQTFFGLQICSKSSKRGMQLKYTEAQSG